MLVQGKKHKKFLRIFAKSFLPLVPANMIYTLLCPFQLVGKTPEWRMGKFLGFAPFFKKGQGLIFLVLRILENWGGGHYDSPPKEVHCPLKIRGRKKPYVSRVCGLFFFGQEITKNCFVQHFGQKILLKFSRMIDLKIRI